MRCAPSKCNGYAVKTNYEHQKTSSANKNPQKIPNFIKIAIFQHSFLKITAKHEQTWYQCLILGVGYRGQKSQIWAHIFFKLPPRMRNTNQKKFFKNIDLKMSCTHLSEGDWETPRFCLKMDENDQ